MHVTQLNSPIAVARGVPLALVVLGAYFHIQLSPTTIFPLVVQGGLKAEQQYGTHCCFLLKNLQFNALQFTTDFTTTS